MVYTRPASGAVRVYHIFGDEKRGFSRTRGLWYYNPHQRKKLGLVSHPSRYSHSSNTAFTYALSLIFDISLCAPTEQTSRGVLPKDYSFLLCEHLQRVFLSNPQRPSHLDGEYDTSKFIYLPDYSCRFHLYQPSDQINTIPADILFFHYSTILGASIKLSKFEAVSWPSNNRKER